MTPEERTFLRDFFRAVTDQPLEPTDPRYISLYTDPNLVTDDPVELMARAIEWTPGESVQLFSGFRGTGKSTELRRLRKRLKESNYLVFLCDIEDYLNLSTPVDVIDFLMAVAGAFSEAITDTQLLGQPLQEDYWTRLWNFLTRTQVNISELSGGVDLKAAAPATVTASIKANLKSDPTFKQRVQKYLSGHLGALVADVRKFVENCVKQLKQRLGQDREVVLLLDSVEHIRGTSINAIEVQSSVETLFASHADKLRLPYLHVVYTVPPYLKVRYPNLGTLYQGGIQVLPAFKLRNTDHSIFQQGLDAIERVVRARGDWQRLLGERTVLDHISLCSGGHLRDLLRLLAEILRRADRLPTSEHTVTTAINQVRTEFFPIADADAQWLARIAKTHEAGLQDIAQLPNFARFLDIHMALCYRNGEEWYDVHPLIYDQVNKQAAAATSPQSSPTIPASKVTAKP
ncbi:MAG: hypothetical protein AB7P69_06370 [Candidatus Binatia bacterium]